MSLIYCPECGKEFSDLAPACPNCGFPTSEISHDAANIDTSAISSAPTATSVNTPITFKATKKIGPVQIDEPNRSFRIYGAVPASAKNKSFAGTALKGVLAVYTLGMSVAAEKALGHGKVGKKSWYSFDELISYELIEDDSLITSGGVGQALIGGALFGGLGAVAGGITAKRTQKKKVESLYIKATLNDFSNPCVLIPLITKSTKINSSEYKNAFNMAQQILSIFDVITHNKF